MRKKSKSCPRLGTTKGDLQAHPKREHKIHTVYFCLGEEGKGGEKKKGGQLTHRERTQGDPDPHIIVKNDV